MEPEELDARVDGFSWEDGWDNFTGPQASAFHLLKSIDLGPADSPLRREGEVILRSSAAVRAMATRGDHSHSRIIAL